MPEHPKFHQSPKLIRQIGGAESGVALLLSWVAMPGDARNLDVRQRGPFVQSARRFVAQIMKSEVRAARRDEDPFELTRQLARHAPQGQRATFTRPKWEEPPTVIPLSSR